MQLRPSLCLVLFLALMAGMSAPAQAGSKILGLFWWPGHWENLTWHPYLDQSRMPQNSQWDEDKWEPADWAAQRPGGELQLINGFYTAKILSHQYVYDHVPVLEVGPGFYDLSGYDKRRILRVVDDYYKITSAHENGMFTLTDYRTHDPIGLYTANGLQLQ